MGPLLLGPREDITTKGTIRWFRVFLTAIPVFSMWDKFQNQNENWIYMSMFATFVFLCFKYSLLCKQEKHEVSVYFFCCTCHVTQCWGSPGSGAVTSVSWWEQSPPEPVSQPAELLPYQSTPSTWGCQITNGKQSTMYFYCSSFGARESKWRV